MTELRGKRIVVMGLGGFGGGAGAARFCATEGASVTVTDLRPASQLAASLNHLDGLPIRYRLGRHEESDFTSCDLVVVNPAVDPRDNPYLQASLGAGAILTSEIQLLIERLDRRRVIAVTGTAGKSTTVAMIGHLLQAAFGPRRVHLGGNIGGSLLNELDRIGPDDWVVLELSSFMLEMLADWSPHIAVLTNLRDNHLDRHGTFDRYAAAKQRIFEFQEPGDLAIVTPGLPPQIQPRVRTYTVEPPGVRDWPPLRIPGRHNRLNARIALCAAQCAGAVFADAQALERVLESFTGLPHRMQLVAEHGGARCYDDSKSTTPESAVLALEAFEPGTVHAILGGYDKHADLRPLARHAATHCAAIYTIGATGDALARTAEEHLAHERGARAAVHRCGTLADAVPRALAAAGAGHVILLSPGCASWDQFPNYEERGRAFAQLIARYTHGS